MSVLYDQGHASTNFFQDIGWQLVLITESKIMWSGLQP